MKNILLVVVAVLTTATVANANLILNVDEATNTIGISGDGATAPPIAAYLFVEGPGSIAGGNMIYPGTLAAYDDLEAIAADLGISLADTLAAFQNFLNKPSLADLSLITLADGAIPPAPLQGLLVEGIGLTRAGPVVLTLVSDDFATVYDTKIISIPEPLSIALLGLGGLFLRRRR
jgi:hypothetical protein